MLLQGADALLWCSGRKLPAPCSATQLACPGACCAGSIDSISIACSSRTPCLPIPFRPLFTQPHNLNRYEQDSQRAVVAAAGPHSLDPGCAAATAATATQAVGGLPSPGTSPPSPTTAVMLQAAPLLTPLRVGQLSVVDPAAGARSPFSIADDRSPLPSDLSSPCRSADLAALWDAEHAELFAADPELHSALSIMLESTVSCGLGLAEGSEAAAEAAVAAAAADAGTAKAIALASNGGDGACSPTAILLAGAEQASDGSGSDGETCCADAVPAALRSGSPQTISLRAVGRLSLASPFAMASSFAA